MKKKNYCEIILLIEQHLIEELLTQALIKAEKLFYRDDRTARGALSKSTFLRKTPLEQHSLIVPYLFECLNWAKSTASILQLNCFHSAKHGFIEDPLNHMFSWKRKIILLK